MRDGAPRSLGRAAWAAAHVLASRLERGFPPGAVAALVDREGVVGRMWGGCAAVVPERVPVAQDTLFDLASLTKVTVTVPLVLLLRDRGLWSLADPVRRWVAGFPDEGVTLWHCLTHTSGLPPHRPFYRVAWGRGVRLALLKEARRTSGTGEVAYSDLNFMLLGWAVESCAGRRLRQLARDDLLGPLGMRRTDFRPGRRLRRRTAATEADGDQRPTPGVVWGEVHDGNAWAMGGVAGHAGLFAPLDDLAAFAGALLRPRSHPVLQAHSIAEMGRRQAGAPPDVRGLGWRLAPDDWGGWPPTTRWHTGFTGTSLVVCPDRGLALVLLTNAVHPRRRPEGLAELRREVHQAVAAEVQ
ncbi:MAG TPA: serine hydrolase domain-containing protein [Candidatus Dormibacteraeota bacterium]|nr:serine hydrolase domain-containing protein [Candidatus Dormibacteraeota bacterium]